MLQLQPDMAALLQGDHERANLCSQLDLDLDPMGLEALSAATNISAGFGPAAFAVMRGTTGSVILGRDTEAVSALVSGQYGQVIEGEGLGGAGLGPDVGLVLQAGNGRRDDPEGSFSFARLVAPVRESILHTPPIRTRAKASGVAPEPKSERRSVRLASKLTSGLTVEEQATALLLKKCGVSVAASIPTTAEQIQFHQTFLGPLQHEVLGDMREAFGLPEGEAADSLGPLLIDAEA